MFFVGQLENTEGLSPKSRESIHTEITPTKSPFCATMIFGNFKQLLPQLWVDCCHGVRLGECYRIAALIHSKATNGKGVVRGIFTFLNFY